MGDFAPLRWSSEPYRSLYLLYCLFVIILVKAPFWTLQSIIPSLRPRPSWSWYKSLRHRLLNFLLDTIRRDVGDVQPVPNYLSIPQDLKPHVTGVWVDPVSDLFVQGQLREWATRVNVQPARIPAYWYQRNGEPSLHNLPAQPGERVIINFHGGGFVAQSAHPSDLTQNITRGVLKQVKGLRRVLSVEYRLSTAGPHFPPANPFPAALLDAVSAYNYVVSQVGFKPDDIILMGDSAGANLALALTRYLLTGLVPSLRPPKGLILNSPWVDLGPSHLEGPDASFEKFESTDIIGDALRREEQYGYCVRAFTSPYSREEVATNPYISPASLHISEKQADSLFTGFPQTIIFAGGVEQLLDAIRTLRDRMEKNLGTKLKYCEFGDAFHDWIAFPWAMPERKEALQVIDEWWQDLQ